ncbi:hypothetical protein HRbin31_00760 [bacterium HR31]|nr:hypothetical protein HRbin31_00760 [bacterium HR31]
MASVGQTSTHSPQYWHLSISMSNRVSTRSFPFPVASMWMHRLGQIRSHWKQMMHRSLPVSVSTGRARSPCQRGDTLDFSRGYRRVTFGRVRF